MVNGVLLAWRLPVCLRAYIPFSPSCFMLPLLPWLANCFRQCQHAKMCVSVVLPPRMFGAEKAQSPGRIRHRNPHWKVHMVPTPTRTEPTPEARSVFHPPFGPPFCSQFREEYTSRHRYVPSLRPPRRLASGYISVLCVSLIDIQVYIWGDQFYFNRNN